jgi:hypothetical protein
MPWFVDGSGSRARRVPFVLGAADTDAAGARRLEPATLVGDRAAAADRELRDSRRDWASAYSRRIREGHADWTAGILPSARGVGIGKTARGFGRTDHAVVTGAQADAVHADIAGIGQT